MSAGATKAEALDRTDPLGGKRELFELPAGVVYLDGNSLGPPPKAAFAELEQAVRREWGEGLIRSWNAAGWWSLTDTLGDRIGRLIGEKRIDLRRRWRQAREVESHAPQQRGTIRLGRYRQPFTTEPRENKPVDPRARPAG